MSRINRLIAIAAITLFVVPIVYVVGSVAYHVATHEKKGEPRVRMTSDAELLTSINPKGDVVQSAYIKWENIGDCPVRMLVADIQAFDERNKKIESVSGYCCIFWTANNNTRGVPKGEEMTLASKAKPLQVVGFGPLIKRIEVTLGKASQYTPAEFND